MLYKYVLINPNKTDNVKSWFFYSFWELPILTRRIFRSYIEACVIPSDIINSKLSLLIQKISTCLHKTHSIFNCTSVFSVELEHEIYDFYYISPTYCILVSRVLCT